MNSRNGILAAGLAYVAWGLLPIYWRGLHTVPPLEILSHRVFWSLVVVGVLLAVRSDWQWLGRARRRPALLGTFVVTALLLSANWLVYIWANNNGHIVEASLGYFITPLVSILLGLLVLREQLRIGQWLAIAIAALGVGYLTLNAGGLLWISLALAFTFGFYGLLRKTAPFGSLDGLTVEMTVLFLPALAYLVYLEANGASALGHRSGATNLLLLSAGVVTAVPLLFFAYGAQRVPLSALGILQYVAPTLQFLLAVFVFGEALTRVRVVGFSVIWTALLIYTVEGYVSRRKRVQALAGG